MRLSYGQRIPIKTRAEVDRMREAGRHVGEILLELCERVRPGVSTLELDRHARERIHERDVTSSFLGYGPHGQLQEARNTTPDPLTLQQLLADFRNRGMRRVVMEVSSGRMKRQVVSTSSKLSQD